MACFLCVPNKWTFRKSRKIWRIDRLQTRNQNKIAAASAGNIYWNGINMFLLFRSKSRVRVFLKFFWSGECFTSLDFSCRTVPLVQSVEWSRTSSAVLAFALRKFRKIYIFHILARPKNSGVNHQSGTANFVKFIIFHRAFRALACR